MYKVVMTTVAAAMMMIGVNAPAHAFFGFFEKEPNPIIFAEVENVTCSTLDGKKGYGYEETINAKAECQIKKLFVNKKGQMSGVMGNWFYIVVQVNDAAELVTMNTKDFQKLGKDKAKEELKTRIKAKVKAMIKAQI